MIHFDSTRSINLYDKIHSTVVLFATFHCRDVDKVRKKWQIFFRGKKEKRTFNFNKYVYFSMASFEGLRNCNANLKVNVVLLRAVKTCKGSMYTAVFTD